MTSPALKLLLDSDVVKLVGTLVGRLESFRYDEHRRGVFRTRWAKDLFTTTIKVLGAPALDIDEWYRCVVEANAPAHPKKFEFAPHHTSQDVETNWLAPLLELEMQHEGFIRLFHNILELEGHCHATLVAESRTLSYDFVGVRKHGPKLLTH